MAGCAAAQAPLPDQNTTGQALPLFPHPPLSLGAGSGDVGVVLEDPAGRRDTVEVTLEDRGDSTFRCSYRPTLPGPHRVAVTFAGAHIPNSPFCVNVAEGEPP